MLAEKQSLIQAEIVEGTGAEIGIKVLSTGVQTGLKIWFADLGSPRSPIIDLRPYGLKRHRAVLTFGDYAGDTVSQMQKADDEERQLAIALVRSIGKYADVTVNGEQTIDDWAIHSTAFKIIAERKDIGDRFGDEALIVTCSEVVTPLLAAMAELYGYDPIDDSESESDGTAMEGALKVVQIRRRERNPRNRLLCLRVHGEVCKACDLEPRNRYGGAGAIIEVHHLQPLSQARQPRSYDPELDLVPLCPNCHRAVHTRRPIPWTIEELRQRLSSNG